MSLVVLLTVLIFFGIIVFNQYKARLIGSEKSQLETRLNLIGDPVSQMIAKRWEMVSGLERFVLIRSDGQIKTDFDVFAQGLHNNAEGVRNVGIAPDGILTYIYPKKGNEAAIGYNLLTDPTPSVKSDVSRAIGIKQIVVSDPFELRQGGLGIAARKAVFKDGKLWGLVSVVIDVPSITSRIENVGEMQNYKIALRSKSGDVFWGRKEVFDNNPIIKKIDLVDGYWELGGIPVSGWESAIRDELIIFSAVEISLLLMFLTVMMLLLIRWEKLVSINLTWDTRKEALKPTVWYFLLSAAWILFSDQLVGMLVSDQGMYIRISIMKGWLFVVVTSLLLFLWEMQSFSKLDELLSFFKKTQKVAKLGYYVLDIRTGIWEGSDMLKKIFGIDERYKTDVDGWLDLIHPDQRKEMEEYFRKEIIDKMRPFDREYKIINRVNGSEVWVHGIGNLEFDARGNPVRMIGTIQDITDIKLKEIELKESEARFRYLFDLTTQGVILQDSTGIILDINQAAINIFGIPKGQIVGKKFEDYGWKIIDEDGGKFEAKRFASRQAVSQGRSIGEIVFGVYLPHKNNELRWISTSSNPIFKKGVHEPYLTITTLSDITEKKKFEDDLMNVNKEVQSEKQKLETVLRDMGDAVIAVDEKGIIQIANQGASELIGMSKEELIGKTVNQIIKMVSEKTGEKQECLVDSVLRNGEISWPKEPLILESIKGKSVPVDGVATPIKDNNGNISGAVMVLRDVAKERSLNKMKEDFVSMASHQLRTPLTGIKWFVELLREKDKVIPAEKTREYVDKIGESNQRLIDLVNDLLITSRIEEGGLIEKDLMEHSIKDIIHEALVIQGNTIADKNIHVEGVDFIPEEIVIEADRIQMIQVFGNIINNAVSYSPVGSRVDIWVEKKDSMIDIMVKDEGIGIPENQKTKVFDKFFRADNVTKHIPGSGLGLYVTKTIVEGHGGKIWFESAENKGTTFFVELPIKQKKDGK